MTQVGDEQTKEEAYHAARKFVQALLNFRSSRDDHFVNGVVCGRGG
jgi:hypothetical protein